MLNHLHNHSSASAAGGPLSIEQLLQAARLIEQRAIEKMLVGGNMPIDGNNNNEFVGGGGGISSSMFPAMITKLGEDYEERMLVSKMRANFMNAYAAPNSTGSSRRSSPISIASSAPSSPGASQSFLMCAAAAGALAANNNNIGQQKQQQHGMTTPLMTMMMTAPTTSNGTIKGTAADVCNNNNANVRAASSASSSASSSRNGTARHISGSRQSRAAHNELEKNRRANLRSHLEALKSVLAPETDTHRDTTLSLLTRARNCIRFIKEQKSLLADRRAELLAEHLRLREQLIHHGDTTVPAVVDMENVAMCAPPTAPIVVLCDTQNAEQQQAAQLFTTANNNKSEQQQSSSSNSENFDCDAIALAQSATEPQNEPFVGAAAVPSASNNKPDMDFLLLNGLLPALPLLYPYSAESLLATLNM